ncbi:MAG: tyrosine-type recombinase/integrase [Opitutae bacterium]|nr:tyrosine-type recombinase/integrase [Opitutae bacterium]
MLPRPRSGWHLPEVLSNYSLRASAAPLHLVYITAMGLAEAVNLQACHINNKPMQIRAVAGKGTRDRYTVLAPAMIIKLRVHRKRQGCTDYLFPAKDGYGPMCEATSQYAYKITTKRAEITKQGNVHLLRYSFATHSLEGDMNLTVIQHLLRYGDLHTTAPHSSIFGAEYAIK